MGRKKRKYVKPWCWYCNREFEDEAVLIQHQKERFFLHGILLWLNNCPLKVTIIVACFNNMACLTK